ncbi:MAG: efflux RND transporter periplasmic adaptor subunit [Candidatus Methylomirabilales bacterium]
MKGFSSKKGKKTFLILLAFGLLLLASVSFLKDGGAIAVRAVRIQRGEMLVTIPSTATGIVESEKEVRVKAEVAGKVDRLLVDEGDQVRAGQTLALLDQKEARARVNLARANLQAAQARLAQAEAGEKMLETHVRTRIAETAATLEKATKNLERMRSLSIEGAIAQAELDLAKAEHEVAKAAYEAALANRDQLEVKRREVEAARANVKEMKASLKLEEVRFSQTVITSPINGLVVKKHASEGETVGLGGGPFFTLGEPLFTLVDPQKLWIRATIDEVDAAKVKVGLPARVTMDAFSGKTFLGKVVKVSPAVRGEGQEARTITIYVALEEKGVKPPAPLFKPGMSADVEVIVSTLPQALLLPTQAILKREGGNFVYVIREGRARLRPFTMGESNWNTTEIRGGIQEGELVILTPDAPGLKEGARVKAVEVEME